jgi:predicted nucleic acid-binding protein
MIDRPERVFLDTNIVLRATVPSAPNHVNVRLALDILARLGSTFWINRQVLREYAMTVTRAQHFMMVVSHQEAARLVRQLMTLFQVADETQAVSDTWATLLETIPMGGKQVHDANIAATMIAYGIRDLLTLNEVDFRRFEPQIRVLSLADVEAMDATSAPDQSPPS